MKEFIRVALNLIARSLRLGHRLGLCLRESKASTHVVPGSGPDELVDSAIDSGRGYR